MGLVFSVLWSTLFGSKQRKVVIVGLDNAGKTSILYRLNLVGGAEPADSADAGGIAQASAPERGEEDAKAGGDGDQAPTIQTVPTIGWFDVVSGVMHNNLRPSLSCGGRDGRELTA